MISSCSMVSSCKTLTLFGSLVAILLAISGCGGEVAQNDFAQSGAPEPVADDPSAGSDMGRSAKAQQDSLAGTKLKRPTIEFRTPSGEPDIEGPIDPDSQYILDHRGQEGNRVKLRALLAHPNPRVRQTTADAFGYISELEAEDFAPIVKLLVDPNPDVRKAAADTIQDRSEYLEDAKLLETFIPQIIAALYDPESEVVYSAGWALEGMGAKAAPAIPILVDMIRNEREVGTALDLLGTLGPEARPAAANAVQALLGDSDHAENAAKALGKMGVTDPLFARLKAKYSWDRDDGLLGLGFVRPTNDKIINVLFQYTDDKVLQLDAIKALGHAHPTSDKIVAKLGQLLKSPDVITRRAAVAAFSEIDPKLDSAVPHLLAALKDKDISDSAASALEQFEASPDVRIRSLLSLKNESDGRVAYSARSAIGEAADQAYPILMKLGRDASADESERLAALEVLQGIRYEFKDEQQEQINPLMIEILASSDSPISLASFAASSLGSGHRQLPRFAEALKAGLGESKHAFVRRDAAARLGNIEAVDATKLLIKALDDEYHEVGECAARALGEIGAEEAVPALSKVAQDEKSEFRSTAIIALGNIGRPVDVVAPILLKAANSVEKSEYGLGMSLATMIENSRDNLDLVARPLLPLLKSDNNLKRAVAAEAFSGLGEEHTEITEQVVKGLAVLLSDEDMDVREEAAESLRAFGKHAAGAVTELVAAMKDPENSGFHYYVLAALDNSHADGNVVVPLFADLLKNEARRVTAAQALVKYGAEARTAVPQLIQVLAVPDAYHRQAAVSALAAIGADAAAAVPKLRELAGDDPDEDVRVDASKALVSIKPDDPEALKLFATQLGGDEYDVRRMLEELGERALPVLLAGAKHDDPKIRKAAYGHLKVVKDQKAVTPIYVAALEDADEDVAVRLQSALALQRIGGYLRQTVPVLIESLASEDEDERDEVRNAITNLEWRAPAILADAIRNKDLNPRARHGACEILIGNFAGEAQQPGSFWKELQASDDSVLRGWAAVALYRRERQTGDPASLLAHFDTDDPALRRHVIASFRGGYRRDEISRLDDRVVQALIKTLADEDDNMRREAASAFWNVALEDQHADSIRKLLQQEEAASNVVDALARAKQLPASLTDDLIQLLRSDKEIPSSTGTALQKVGKPAIGPLLEVASDEACTQTGRQMAIIALGEMESLSDDQMRALAQIVKGKNATLRMYAAGAMGRLGLAHPQVLAALVESTKVEEWSLRQSSDGAFRKLGDKAMPALPDLINLLKDSKAGTRSAAANVLATIAPESQEAVEAVVGSLALKQEDYERERMVYQILQFKSAGLNQLVKALGSEHPQVRIAAAKGLGDYYAGRETEAPPKGAVENLRKLLAGDDEAALAAAAVLSHLAPDTEGLLPIFVKALDSEQSDQRYTALGGIRALGPRAEPAVAKLITLLDDEDVSSNAMSALGAIGPAAVPAADKLLDAFMNSDNKYAAAEALAKIGPHAKQIAPQLIAALQNELLFDRALHVLSRMDGEAAPAVEVLQQMLADPWDREPAIDGLRTLGEVAAPAIPALIELLDGDDPRVKSLAIRALSNMGEPARQVEPRLIALLDEGEKEIQHAAAQALGKLKSAEGLPKLIAALVSEDEELQSVAARAIGNYEDKAASAVEPLVAALDRDAVRRSAMQALRRIGPAAAPAVGKLTNLLSSEKTSYQAAWTLGQIGPAAKSALPELEKLLATDGSTREIAIEAVWKIDAARAKQLELPETESK